MRQLKRRNVLLATGIAAALVAAGSALGAGDGLGQKSNSANVKSLKSVTVSVDCGKSGDATAAGFKAALHIAVPSTLQAIYPLKQTIAGGKAKIGAINPGNATDKLTAYAYCGGPKLTTASAEKLLNSTTNTTVTAHCKGGKTPYSGGFSSTVKTSGPSVFTGAIPLESYRASKHSWKAVFVPSGDPAGQKVHAYAYCAKGKPLAARATEKKLQGIAPSPTSKLDATNIDAKCEPGETVISGGFRTAKPPSPMGGPVTVASYRKSGSSWRSKSAFAAPGSAKLTTYAYCLKN